MYALLGSILQLVALGYAFVGSLRARYFFGAGAAVVRIAWLVAGASVGFKLNAPAAEGGAASARSSGLRWVGLAITLVGSLVSFTLLALTRRRMRGVSAADEPRARRLFAAWLPAALFDAVFVVINVIANAAIHGDHGD